MRHLNWVLLSGLFLCGLPIQAVSGTQSDILYDKVERLEKDVMSLQRKLYTGALSAQSTTAAGGTASLDDVYTQLNEQQKVITDLTAKVERLEYDLTQMEERLKKMNADNDVRFSMMENKTGASPATAAPAKNAAAGDVKAEYDKAYDALRKGDYKAAESAFTAFIKKHPNSDLAGNANYWLGETYYARGQYEQAVGIFADGFTKYKKNSKAPDNLLKLGLSMHNLGRKQDACTAFTALPNEFPKAEQRVKDRAKAEAKKLSCK